MAPTRSGGDTERPGGFPMSPGVIYDADGNPVGFAGEDEEEETPQIPGAVGFDGLRGRRRRRAQRDLGETLGVGDRRGNALTRGLRGLGRRTRRG